jgi:hypothetical protein
MSYQGGNKPEENISPPSGLIMFLALVLEFVSIINFIVYMSIVLQACYPVFNA